MKTGKLSESVLKRSVLRQLKTKNELVECGAGVGNDCALFSLGTAEADQKSDRIVSCVQEGILKDADTVTRLIQKSINNLAVSGARPFAVMIALLLPESTEEPYIKALMKAAEEVCAPLDIEIAGGQTRITEALQVPVAVVTGYGRLTGKFLAAKQAKPGQDIVISKWIGLEGTAILAKRYEKELLSRYPRFLVEEAKSFDRYFSVVGDAAIAVKSGVCAMHDASEGGIFGALWELAESAGIGLSVNLKKLPLRQETVEVCEFCGKNPYQLRAGGCLIMTAEDGDVLANALAAERIPAAVVGRTTENNDRVVINEDEVRYLTRPQRDEVY